jgi:hypothetical protein
MKPMAALVYVLVPSLGAIGSVALVHDRGVDLARHLGRTLRGGVGWGIALLVIFTVFVLLVLIQAVATLRWPARRIAMALAVWLVVAGLGLLTGPFGTGGHPYRFLYLLACCAAGLCVLLAGQFFLDPRRQERNGA